MHILLSGYIYKKTARFVPRQLYFLSLVLSIFREQKLEKPKILAELIAQNYKVQEVNFDTMLSIVQSCQELQHERINGSLEQLHDSKLKKEPQTRNFFTLFKGILPGQLVHSQYHTTDSSIFS